LLGVVGTLGVLAGDSYIWHAVRSGVAWQFIGTLPTSGLLRLLGTLDLILDFSSLLTLLGCSGFLVCEGTLDEEWINLLILTRSSG
jgi:hypothetical protein